jgi:uncharacterized protein YndB with AHSA1/START domain
VINVRSEAKRNTSGEIRHDVPLSVPAGEIYSALTNVESISKWWIPDTRGKSEVGRTLEFWFSDKSCQKMTVTSLFANEYVRWDAVGEDGDDWAGTFVEFKILHANSRVLLRFRHAGWLKEVERFPYYSFSWAVFLVSLKDLLEKGSGYPFPNAWVNG